MLTSPRILERQLGVLSDPTGELGSLEDRLAAFSSELGDSPVDETDERSATIEYVRRLSAAGLLDLVVPRTFGGADDDVRSTPLCLVRQWLARSSGALDTAFAMQGLGSYPVTLAGTDALRQSLLPRVRSGEAICAFALTEPGAGSDVSGMATVAEPSPDGSVRLRGTKCFISNAGLAHSYVVFAREQEPGEDGKPRFGAFWVPGDAAGLQVEPIRVTAPHPIGTVTFDGVEIPAEHRVGASGKGLHVALSTLDVFRVTVGAAALGLADRAITEAVGHLREREQFGRPLAKQQGLRFAMADVATEHVAAQLLVYRAAVHRDEGTATPDQPAMAKLYATEAAQRAVDRAVQSLGGRGVVVGETVERLYREVRALRIYEGTSEIQKLVIARHLLG